MVNGHTHAAMTLFRGFGDDMPLMEWLETRIWPAEAKLEPEDVYWGTRLACVEMIRAGTTRFVDMYWHGAEVAAAVRDAGVRAVVSSVIIDRLDPAKGEALRPEVLEVLERLGEAGSLVQPSLGPHAIYTVSSETSAVDRRARRRTRDPAPYSPLRDRAGGGRLPRGPRQAARRATSTSSASSGRGRCSRTASGSMTRSSS